VESKEKGGSKWKRDASQNAANSGKCLKQAFKRR